MRNWEPLIIGKLLHLLKQSNVNVRGMSQLVLMDAILYQWMHRSDTQLEKYKYFVCFPLKAWADKTGLSREATRDNFEDLAAKGAIRCYRYQKNRGTPMQVWVRPSISFVEKMVATWPRHRYLPMLKQMRRTDHLSLATMVKRQARLLGVTIVRSPSKKFKNRAANRRALHHRKKLRVIGGGSKATGVGQ